MRTDDDINFSIFEELEDIAFFFGASETVDIFNFDAELFESAGESFGMLEGEDGGRNEDSDLFFVEYGFEGSSDGHFGFAEADIAADEAVHGVIAEHIILNGDGCFELVGGIFVDEGGFEFVLEIVVGGEGKTRGGFSFGVELDEFFGDILDFLFGFSFEVFPGFGAEFMELRFGTVFAGVFGDFVEGVDADV
jgi:hypothetical protein